MKLLCDHAAECGQRCKHATAHESYGQQCEREWMCVHVRAGQRTVCKPLDDVSVDEGKEEKP